MARIARRRARSTHVNGYCLRDLHRRIVSAPIGISMVARPLERLPPRVSIETPCTLGGSRLRERFERRARRAARPAIPETTSSSDDGSGTTVVPPETPTENVSRPPVASEALADSPINIFGNVARRLFSRAACALSSLKPNPALPTPGFVVGNVTPAGRFFASMRLPSAGFHELRARLSRLIPLEDALFGSLALKMIRRLLKSVSPNDAAAKLLLMACSSPPVFPETHLLAPVTVTPPTPAPTQPDSVVELAGDVIVRTVLTLPKP